MSDSAAGNATAIEWFVLIVVSAVILLIAYRFLSKRGRELRMGDWGKLVQTIIRDIGEQQLVHTAVKDFIEHGRKERLIVALTKIMSRNGVSDDRIAYALQPLVGYIPNERNMYPIWARGNVQASFERRGPRGQEQPDQGGQDDERRLHDDAERREHGLGGSQWT